MEVVDKAIEKFIPDYDTPKKGDLIVLISPMFFSDDEILIGDKNYIQKTCIPFIMYDEKYYKADTLEVVPNEVSMYVSSARKYVLVDGSDLSKIEDKFVYKF